MVMLALVLAAAPIDVHLRSAALLGPTTNAPIGWAETTPVQVVAWSSPTVLTVRHDSAAVTFEALIDLSREATEVEVRLHEPVQVSGVGAWRVVLKASASVPLVGHGPEGLRLAFLPEMGMPFETVTLAPDAPPRARTSLNKLTRIDCTARALHLEPEPTSPELTLKTSAWTVYRLGPDVDGFTPVLLENAVAEVTGFAPVSSLRCGASNSSGLGIAGTGAGAADGSLAAEAAVLPAMTRLLEAPDGAVVATVKRKTGALALPDGTWRLDALQHGGATVQFTRVVLEAGVTPKRGPRRSHGIGRTTSLRSDWPRPR
jgi:hypothetical protein